VSLSQTPALGLVEFGMMSGGGSLACARSTTEVRAAVSADDLISGQHRPDGQFLIACPPFARAQYSRPV